MERHTWELKTFLGLVLWIYREILHIFYIYFFLPGCWSGPPFVLQRARPCLKTSPPNYWQGLDNGSLTCALIGRQWAFIGNSASAEQHWMVEIKRARCKVPTQSDDRRIYFNLKKHNVHIVKFCVKIMLTYFFGVLFWFLSWLWPGWLKCKAMVFVFILTSRRFLLRITRVR